MTDNFRETQRFNQRWLWILLIATNMVVLGIFGYGLVEQLVFDRPWGDRPVSDGVLVLVSGGAMLFSGGMLYIFYTLRLITAVSAGGLYVRFAPFPGKTIPFDDIHSCEARTYRPLAEYGGWGIKWGRSGKAYNISGNRGAQLVMKDGRRILIGSQRADELAAAIKLRL